MINCQNLHLKERRMSKHILFCKTCKRYTMEKVCKCGHDAILARPPKYSLEDKYGSYRRQIKEKELSKQGLL